MLSTRLFVCLFVCLFILPRPEAPLQGLVKDLDGNKNINISKNK